MNKIYRIDCTQSDKGKWKYEVSSTENDQVEILFKATGFSSYEIADSHASDILKKYVNNSEPFDGISLSEEEYKSLKSGANKWVILWLITFIMLLTCIFLLATHHIK